MMLFHKRYFQNTYRLASLLGITPLYDFKKGKLMISNHCKMYNVILMIIQIVLFFPLIYLIEYNKESKLITLLINCTLFTTCLSTSTMTWTTVTKRLEWKKMLRLIRYAEKIVLCSGEPDIKNGRRAGMALLYVVSIFFMNYTVYEVCMEIMKGAYITIAIFYLRFTTATFIFLTTEVCEIVYKLFQDLNEYTKLCLLKTTISQINNYKVVLADVSKIRRNYRILNEIVEFVNELFGLSILMFTLNVIFHVLNAMNIFIFKWKHYSHDVDLVVKNFIPAVGCCVSIALNLL